MPFKFCMCMHIQRCPSSKLATSVPWIWQCLLLVAVGIVKTMRCLPSRFWAQQCVCPPGPSPSLFILNPDWLWVLEKGQRSYVYVCVYVCVWESVHLCFQNLFSFFPFLSFLLSFFLFFFFLRKWLFVHKYRVQPSCSHYKTDSMFSHHSWSSRL